MAEDDDDGLPRIRARPKVYSDVDVLTATNNRLRYMFDHFDNVCFAVSGGKDSGLLVQLANAIAAETGRRFSIMFVDLEAMYRETERFVLSIREATKPNCKEFFWICLPMCEDNATSALNPEFITWDESAKDVWVRDIPEGAITVNNNIFPFYENLMDFNDFVYMFLCWLHERNRATRSCMAVGIRTDESIRRFIAVASDTKPTYNGLKWTTEVGGGIYNVYPLYDWRVEDVWGAVAKLDLDYNHVYDAMYKNGVPLSKQRICQPFGSAQKAGLDQFRAIEPETWEKLLARVEGVNFGAIYCRSSLFGNITSMKPGHLTWEQYAVFLLESIGLYEPGIMARYYQKIKYYFLWCEKNMGIPYARVPEADKGDEPSWKRIAKAIERNDFYMTYLQFGYDKAGDRLLIELRERHRLTGDGYMQPKIMARLKNMEKGLGQGQGQVGETDTTDTTEAGSK